MKIRMRLLLRESNLLIDEQILTYRDDDDVGKVAASLMDYEHALIKEHIRVVSEPWEGDGLGKLADYIMHEIENGPIEDDSAGDYAIRLLKRYRSALENVMGLLDQIRNPETTSIPVVEFAYTKAQLAMSGEWEDD